MNVGQIIKAELETLLADVEGSPVVAQVEALVKSETARIETELKAYIDEVIAKAFQPSKSATPQSGS